MLNSNTIILDLTEEHILSGSPYVEGGSTQIRVGPASPFLAAVRKAENELTVLAGDDAGNIVEDDQTLLFDNLNTRLPAIRDEQLERDLISACWSHLSRRLSADGSPGRSGKRAAYVIHRHNWPTSLLERFRSCCAGENSLPAAAFLNEAACLIAGINQSADLREAIQRHYTSGPVTFCVLVSCHDAVAEVCCFDYSKTNAIEHTFVIRDFFRARHTSLADKLKARDWYSDVSNLLSVQERDLDEQPREALVAALSRMSGSNERTIEREQIERETLRTLKMLGAACIAGCSAGDRTFSERLIINAPCNIGIQTSARGFHPVVSKSELAGATRFPFKAEKTFSLKGNPEKELQVNLYSGYSNRLDEATRLAQFTLTTEDLGALKADRQAVLLASIRMDSLGAGECSLELLPRRRLIGRDRFVLPALMM